MTEVAAGQKILADENNDLHGRGIVARGRRTTSSTATTTEQGVLRLDDIPVIAGHCYKIWTSPLFGDTTSANIPGARIRYTTDGTTPTTSSTQLPGSRCDLRQADGSFQESMSIATTYTPASDETLSLLLTCVAVTASSTTLEADSVRIIELVVEDIGIDPGDTGTDI